MTDLKDQIAKNRFTKIIDIANYFIYSILSLV